MTIDFATRERNLNLGYLFRGEYVDQNGDPRAVHWCGPKTRVGSGLSMEVPAGPFTREIGKTVLWEARLSRCSLDAKLGNIAQVIQAITDLNFNVEIQGGPLGDDLSVGDLENDIVYGRWNGRKASLWLVDLDTLDTQQVVYGFFDRNPTSITSGVFQVTVAAAPMIPWRKMPGTLIPSVNEIHSIWTNTSQVTHGAGPASSPGSEYVPATYGLNPDHEGMFLGCTFGSSRGALASLSGTSDTDYIWKELVPYGTKGFAASGSVAGGQMAFAHVDAHTGCYVHEVYMEMAWKDADGNVQPELRPTYYPDYSGLTRILDTFENLDPAKGPIGTNVRLPKISINGPTASLFAFTSGARVFARVSGPGSGISTGAIVDPTGYVQNIYDRYLTGNYVATAPWEILQDLMLDPQYLGPLDRPFWATNALSEFEQNRPLTGGAGTTHYYKMACSIPSVPSICEELPSVREGLQGMASSFPFDIVHRWDETAQEMRMAPVWRSSFSQTPDHIFDVHQLQRIDPPEISQFNNKNGKYANQVAVTSPEYYKTPTNVPLNTTDPETITAGNRLEIVGRTKATLNDLNEQADTKEGSVVAGKREWKMWLHEGQHGDIEASWYLGIESSQPQRTVRAMHGVRSFNVEMGECIRYNVRGVNADNGQVRGMRYDFDRQTVSIESLHIDHYQRRVPPKDSDERFKIEEDEDSDSGEE